MAVCLFQSIPKLICNLNLIELRIAIKMKRSTPKWQIPAKKKTKFWVSKLKEKIINFLCFLAAAVFINKNQITISILNNQTILFNISVEFQTVWCGYTSDIISLVLVCHCWALTFLRVQEGLPSTYFFLQTMACAVYAAVFSLSRGATDAVVSGWWRRCCCCEWVTSDRPSLPAACRVRQFIEFAQETKYICARC